MEMEDLSTERKKRRDGGKTENEGPLEQQIGCSATEDKQQRQSTAADETKQRKPGQGKEEDEEGHSGNGEEVNLFPINPSRRPVVGATKEEVEASCAKWCRVLDDGRYQWDLTKLKCLLSQDELNDR